VHASRYNIIVPLIDSDDYIAVQGCTGAIDRISPKIHRFLEDTESCLTSVSSDTVAHLVRRGYLTNRSPDEERGRMAALAGLIHRRHLQGAAFLIAPTLGCQLRCPYCYEKPTTHRDGQAPTMSIDQVPLVFAAIERIVHEGQKSTPKDVTLYGGEPLLAANREVVRLIMEQARLRGLQTKAVTNGVDLAEAYEDLLGPEGISGLQITIDGPPAIHNKRRVGIGGTSTFAQVSRGVDVALAQGCKVSVRTNVDASNVHSLVELNELYHERGWTVYRGFSAYANVTHDWLKSKMLSPLSLLETVEALFRNSSHSRVISVNFGVDQILTGLLRSASLPALRPYFCGANIGSYIFSPDGFIYTCWDEIGRTDAPIGQYAPKLHWIGTTAQDWTARHVGNIPECLDCPYALLCGGGCGVQAKTKEGSLFRPFCFQFQEIFQFLVPRLFKANETSLSAERVSCT
jgi:uncharacterized protein